MQIPSTPHPPIKKGKVRHQGNTVEPRFLELSNNSNAFSLDLFTQLVELALQFYPRFLATILVSLGAVDVRDVGFPLRFITCQAQKNPTRHLKHFRPTEKPCQTNKFITNKPFQLHLRTQLTTE